MKADRSDRGSDSWPRGAAGLLTGGDHHSPDQLAGVEAALDDLRAAEQGVSLVLLAAVDGRALRP